MTKWQDNNTHTQSSKSTQGLPWKHILHFVMWSPHKFMEPQWELEFQLRLQTCLCHQKGCLEAFSTHLNCIEEAIQFTTDTEGAGHLLTRQNMRKWSSFFRYLQKKNAQQPLLALWFRSPGLLKTLSCHFPDIRNAEDFLQQRRQSLSPVQGMLRIIRVQIPHKFC